MTTTIFLVAFFLGVIYMAICVLVLKAAIGNAIEEPKNYEGEHE